VKFALIDVEKANFPVEVSRSGYYAWRGQATSSHAQTDQELRAEVAAAHERSRRTYGSPRVYEDLKAAGRRTSRKRVARLMREQGLAGRARRRTRRTTDSNHAFPIAPNLLERAFDVYPPARGVGDSLKKRR